MSICFCAAGCGSNPMADPGVWPECHCWCHDRARARKTPPPQQAARTVHYLTIGMGNVCGQPTASPGGGNATSVPGNVTCPDCRVIIAATRAKQVNQ